MAVYITSLDAEVVGMAVLSLLEETQVEQLLSFLSNQNLEKLDPDGWYSDQGLLHLLKAVEENPKCSWNAMIVGTKILEVLPSAGIASIETFLTATFAILQAVSCNRVQISMGNQQFAYSEQSYPDNIQHEPLWGVAIVD